MYSGILNREHIISEAMLNPIKKQKHNVCELDAEITVM